MTWRDRYRTASFRGVEFRVLSSGSGVGRRLARHEYPGRDLPWMEDLGRRARAYQVEGWTVGEDYDRQRERIIEACEREGPGTLVHPYLGQVEVTVESLEVREESGSGGLARLSFVFLEAGRPQAPLAGADTGGALSGAAAALDVSSAADLAARLSIFGQAGVALEAITGSLNEVSRWLGGLPYTGSPGPVGKLVASASGLADRALGYGFDPEQLSGDMGGLVRQVGEAFSSKRDALAALRGAARLANPTFGGSGVQDTAAENGQAVLDFGAAVAIGQAVLLSGELEFESLDDALALRDELAGEIDGMVLRPGVGDLVTQDLEGLRAALFGALPPPGQELPRLATMRPAATLPSLVLAYGLWDDAERAGEIAARNRVRRPGFVPGGQDLEVLSA